MALTSGKGLSPDPVKAWQRTFKEKKKIYGEANRIMPGGRTPGIDAETAKKLVRKEDDIEPVFFFALPRTFYEDLLRCVAARTVTALTLGDGAIALAAMVLNKPFIGVALTEMHANGVKTHLANTVFTGYWTEGSPFYDARIHQELADTGLAHAQAAMDKMAKTPVTKKEKPTTTPPPPTPPPTQAKMAPQPKKAAKRGAATEAEGKQPKAKKAKNSDGDTTKAPPHGAKAMKDRFLEAMTAMDGNTRDEVDDIVEDGDEDVST